METPFAMYDALTSLAVPPEKVRVVIQSMERDLAMFATHSQFSALDQQATARFDLVDVRLATMQQQIATMQQQIEQRLTIRLGALLAVAVATTAALVTLLRP
jgi:hypothetical protein